MDDRTQASPGGRIALWIRLSRWLNGRRVCAIPDCIELTDPERAHCERHIRAFRAELAGRHCREEACVEPRLPGDSLCPDHRELELAGLTRPAAGWNPPPPFRRPTHRSSLRR